MPEDVPDVRTLLDMLEGFVRDHGCEPPELQWETDAVAMRDLARRLVQIPYHIIWELEGEGSVLTTLMLDPRVGAAKSDAELFEMAYRQEFPEAEGSPLEDGSSWVVHAIMLGDVRFRS